MVLGVRALIRGEKGARALGRAADRLAGLAGKRPPADGGYAAWAVRLRTDSAALIASSWARLTLGKAAYALLQAALLWLCLASLGTAPAPAVVFAAFALERLLSMAVITPGATGIVEVGMTGLLVALELRRGHRRRWRAGLPRDHSRPRGACRGSGAAVVDGAPALRGADPSAGLTRTRSGWLRRVT